MRDHGGVIGPLVVLVALVFIGGALWAGSGGVLLVGVILLLLGLGMAGAGR